LSIATATDLTHDIPTGSGDAPIYACGKGTQRLFWESFVPQTALDTRFINQGFDFEWDGYQILKSCG
jgi:hypothetical protein